LIAEDDLLVADMLEQVVLRAGYQVCGIARTVSEGIALGEQHRPELAIIDVRLAEGRLGVEIVAALRGGLPALGILYATGNAGSTPLTSADGHACRGKPYTNRDMVRALKLVEAIVGGGSAVPPFPARFRVLDAPGPTSASADRSNG
jgi:ActR/RegA family two-component response regulator